MRARALVPGGEAQFLQVLSHHRRHTRQANPAKSLCQGCQAHHLKQLGLKRQDNPQPSYTHHLRTGVFLSARVDPGAFPKQLLQAKAVAFFKVWISLPSLTRWQKLMSRKTFKWATKSSSPP